MVRIEECRFHHYHYHLSGQWGILNGPGQWSFTRLPVSWSSPWGILPFPRPSGIPDGLFCHAELLLRLMGGWSAAIAAIDGLMIAGLRFVEYWEKAASR